jgi:hypothetical protein
LRLSNISGETKAHDALNLAKADAIAALHHHVNSAKALSARCVEFKNSRYVCLGCFAKLEKFVVALIAHNLVLACELQA